MATCLHQKDAAEPRAQKRGSVAPGNAMHSRQRGRDTKAQVATCVNGSRHISSRARPAHVLHATLSNYIQILYTVSSSLLLFSSGLASILWATSDGNFVSGLSTAGFATLGPKDVGATLDPKDVGATRLPTE